MSYYLAVGFGVGLFVGLTLARYWRRHLIFGEDDGVRKKKLEHLAGLVKED